ncbi:MAG: ABC transporter ATP-binding protein [Deltaproteobacteria bacterium]
MTPEPVVSAENLRKSFNGIKAVDGISFSVPAGECFGFLGPNGAGKTTTTSMIYCRSVPLSGTLLVFGMDVRDCAREIKSQIGVVPQDNNLDPDLDVMENLALYSRYFGIPKSEAEDRARELLQFLSIDERRREQVTKLSGGMQRRLVIARALINNPRLLLLDEPTTGLDPQARHLIWQRVRELKQRGVTMILTTHYMEEAEKLCDRVAVMDSGRILSQGHPRELIREYAGGDVFEIRRVQDDGILAQLRGLEFSFERAGDTIYIFSKNGDEIGRRLISAKDAEVLRRPANLEDVFLRLTGKELRD